MRDKCKKCGSSEIVVRFIKEGALITSSSLEKIENDFVSCNEYEIYYQLKAKKEHLNNHCRNCQFSWRGNTLDKDV